MNLPQSPNFGDKEMMDDALSSQKFVTEGYNIQLLRKRRINDRGT